MPKKLFTLPLTGVRATLACVAMLLIGSLVVSCTSGTASSGDLGSKKPLVATSFSVLTDMTKAIGGDAVDVESMVPAGQEIHEFDPTPETMELVAKADLLVLNGFGLESWLKKLTRNSNAKEIVASEGVTPIPIKASGDPAEPESVNHSPLEGHPNPHAWMSPDAAVMYAENITKALKELVPAKADAIQQRSDAYIKEIKGVKTQLKQVLDTVPEQSRALVTCEGAFSYLARDMGMHEYYIWPVNSDAEVTPKQVASTVKQVKAHHVPAVFCESTVADDHMQQVARETGAPLAGLLYVDSLTPADGVAPTYLELLKYDAETIANGLKKGAQ